MDFGVKLGGKHAEEYYYATLRYNSVGRVFSVWFERLVSTAQVSGTVFLVLFPLSWQNSKIFAIVSFPHNI
jgi:hypothetical protein